MGIFDFLSGEFIDVIHWVDDTRDTMVWRFEREAHEIKYGAKLTVREGQAAVFVHEGQLADVFTPGMYMLETNNMPILTTLQHWDHGFKSPFKSEIYYVNTTRFNDLKWGTKNPIIVRDPEFGPVRLRAYGTYSVRVSDPARFLTEIVGTDGEFTMDEISYQIRNIIVQEFSRTIARAQIPVLDMAANTRELSQLVGREIAAQLAEYGLTLPELYIENISLPPAVEAVMDKRSSMGVIGNLNEYMQFQAAEALGRDGAGAGAIQAGLGAGLGIQIGQAAAATAGPWGARPAAPQASAPQAPMAPPPPPVEHVWHIAVAGETTGPFSKAAMGRKVTEGALTRNTYVWTPGQDGWQRAEDVTELAQLFTVMPPPPPAA
ncbi:SPFH domain-containing protein [Sulfitobacter sp. M57]|uniref:SPFH domain-containing protein n=1 Tax=unclassified Sulfitobacter TaxID=196795 RepID=UPI0023E23A90|nr:MULTISPECIES: SPFH domain-containing protein [unclassified Sulfitobacter]MDF3414352.1 SPFH domain-containing protein [Sulfitobacter sp. KE5]MDF3420366.1 SPFH domain-containing protein [Sulfitobacter sp. KE43]MDF3432898.1 SPFH domain-containing protein [Sulfitobacter sp. KE42]MDF3458538.1 SPFH domain-containing protein [Sulfitobacter sp. S74]MDF3462438.1 SPFH domain-containing protein [Sulfitobacter sp. Ks18]